MRSENIFWVILIQRIKSRYYRTYFGKECINSAKKSSKARVPTSLWNYGRWSCFIETCWWKFCYTHRWCWSSGCWGSLGFGLLYGSPPGCGLSCWSVWPAQPPYWAGTSRAAGGNGTWPTDLFPSCGEAARRFSQGRKMEWWPGGTHETNLHNLWIWAGYCTEVLCKQRTQKNKSKLLIIREMNCSTGWIERRRKQKPESRSREGRWEKQYTQNILPRSIKLSTSTTISRDASCITAQMHPHKRTD